jgi:archaellum biogenesis protein FlaJ (TadC family)
MSFDVYGERGATINSGGIPAIIGKVATKAAQVRQLIGAENKDAKQIARMIVGLDGVSITALFGHLGMLRPVDRIGSGQALDSVAVGHMLTTQLGGSSRAKPV